MKVAFQKICAIIVILQLFLPFLAKAWKEILSFYGVFVVMVTGNSISTLLAVAVALLLILWILKEDEYKEEKDEDK